MQKKLIVQLYLYQYRRTIQFVNKYVQARRCIFFSLFFDLPTQSITVVRDAIFLGGPVKTISNSLVYCY